MRKEVKDMRPGEVGYVVPWSFEIDHNGETVIAGWYTVRAYSRGTRQIRIQHHGSHVTVLNPEAFPAYEGDDFRMGKKTKDGRILVESSCHGLIPSYRTNTFPVIDLPYKFVVSITEQVKIITLRDGSTMQVIDVPGSDNDKPDSE